jgi:hypothetical protein
MTAMTVRKEPGMHYLSFDDAWQLNKDRHERLLNEAIRSRLRRVRPRPPVDDLPRPPSTGGLPPAA